MKRIYLTVDVEEDIPPYRRTWRGLEKMDTILSILNSLKSSATFFTTAECALRFPEIVEKISEEQDLASHSYAHLKLNPMGSVNKKRAIESTHKLLSKYQKIDGFRAPYFQMDTESLKILKKMNYKYDSSYPTYKFKSQIVIDEYPPTLPNLIFRFPATLAAKIISKCYQKVEKLVLFVHPWEFMQNKHNHRLDCTLLTGNYLIKNFQMILKKLKNNGFSICSIAESGQYK